MFKKFSERFPNVAAKSASYFESIAGHSEQSVSETNPNEHEDASLQSEQVAESPDMGTAAASTASSITASTMMDFMKKAQNAAAIAVKEGTNKAIVLKNKAMDIADMDALQRRLNYTLDRSFYDVNLDLLNFTYVCDNIIAMGFPSMNSGDNRTFLHDNPIDLVSTYLNGRHGQHCMIWNLSGTFLVSCGLHRNQVVYAIEETYDYNFFNNQVLEFKFPGHPAPPLGLLFKMCTSIENWLEADANNVAAIHCLTGKGRTGTVIACYLTWIGKFSSAMEALEFVSERRRIAIEKLTIPSQRRYIEYFNNVMNGNKPNSRPLLLRRIIMNTIPIFGSKRTLESSSPNNADENMQEIVEEGCCPYIQLFRNGKLLFTTAWEDMETNSGVKWATAADGSISFNIDCMLQGDILIRCRHLKRSGQRVSMFRAAFHTGYVSQGILRLTKNLLDGACVNKCFEQDFFIDLIFGDVQAEIPSVPRGDDQASDAMPVHARNEGIELAEEDRVAYEDMLHRDEAFWEDIEIRRLKLKELRSTQEKLASANAASASDNLSTNAEEQKNNELLFTGQDTVSRNEDLSQMQPTIDEITRPTDKKSLFSIAIGDEDDTTEAILREEAADEWDEEKDKEFMSALEKMSMSTADGQLANNPSSGSSPAFDEHASQLSAEVPNDNEDTPDSERHQKCNTADGESSVQKLPLNLRTAEETQIAELAALDAELQELEINLPASSTYNLDGNHEELMDSDDKLMEDTAIDDFDELEQYLNKLSSSTK